MKFVLEQTFHQNNCALDCACQNDFYCFDAFGCIFNFISSKSRILIKISSKHKHSILMKKFDAFAPAYTWIVTTVSGVSDTLTRRATLRLQLVIIYLFTFSLSSLVGSTTLESLIISMRSLQNLSARNSVVDRKKLILVEKINFVVEQEIKLVE